MSDETRDHGTEQVTLDEVVRAIELRRHHCGPHAYSAYSTALEILSRVSGEPPRTVGDTGDGGSGEALFP